MPRILLHPPSGTSTLPSGANPLPQLLHTPSGLAILELQGSINVPAAPSQTSGLTSDEQHAGYTNETPVGRLAFPAYSAANPPEDTAWMKRVYLYVGKHQRLAGEVKKLAKPLAVICRRVGPAADVETMAVDGVSNEEELEIAEIVRFKVIFSQRPEPVGGEMAV
ncbi:hypothetical protein B0A49_13043 [Cryomyces minteri]|uniref:Sister chromatid cohesion protein Ctf8 n=1 Tax=Cryomyces minteri TaxID=331657 RepID=A0A4U0VS57_9PEZI|nr:hypothetical protein B0A49_13043 [Cryomyces minteri]